MKLIRLLFIGFLLFFTCYGSTTNKDVRCLADNIYFESRGEPIVGQALVGYSVLNRVKSSKWPNSVCDVVYQPHQYSWTSTPRSPIEDEEAYNQIEDLAKVLLENQGFHEGTGVNHYLRCDVRHKVKWWKSMVFLGRVGNHCFYKG